MENLTVRVSIDGSSRALFGSIVLLLSRRSIGGPWLGAALLPMDGKFELPRIHFEAFKSSDVLEVSKKLPN